MPHETIYVVSVQNWFNSDTEALEVTGFPVKMCHFESLNDRSVLELCNSEQELGNYSGTFDQCLQGRSC